MNTDELRRAVAADTHQSRDAVATVISSLLSVIEKTLVKGDRVQLRGFGTFEVRLRPARRGFNPATGAPIQIQEKNIPNFRPSQLLTGAVNQELNS